MQVTMGDLDTIVSLLGLFEFDDGGAGHDLLADGDHYLFDDAGPVGVEHLLHLHGFEDAYRVSGDHLVAGVYLDGQDGAGHGGAE